MHRDIKTENILISKEGVLKIADFGLARKIEENCNFTNKVVTLWYRPPELLLGDRKYTTAVDMWSAGCVMAEFWARNPIMPGKSEQEQLQRIAQLCGSIIPEVWPTVHEMPLYPKLELPTGHRRRVTNYLQQFTKDNDACDLLDQLMQLCPSERLDAGEALNHDFFWLDPIPSNASELKSRLFSPATLQEM